MIRTPWPLDGEVHLHGLVLSHDPAELTRLGGLLSANEASRAGSLKSDPVKRRFVAGRGVLREILGGYLGIDGKHVQLTAGEHGKPFLVDRTKGLSFNLAHSGDTVLLAVAAGREVGVDIERIDAGKPLGVMAGMVFSHREQEQLSGLAPPQREEIFYRCWVRKEACLKACGTGFSLPVNSFEVPPPDEGTGVLTACCQGKYWHVLDIDVPRGFCGALAVETCGSTQPPPTVIRVDHGGRML
jgi:4'-phosphopantetheinyl transferase